MPWSSGSTPCCARSISCNLLCKNAAPPSPRGVLANRDPKTFSLAAHNQELVLGHMTFVLQQLLQISLERGLCFNHRIEGLLHCGRQIICIDVLPLQFFPCHAQRPPPLWGDGVLESA